MELDEEEFDEDLRKSIDLDSVEIVRKLYSTYSSKITFKKVLILQSW